MMGQNRVLVLNKGYTAVGIATVKRAFGLLMSYHGNVPKARIVDTDFQVYAWSDWAKMRPMKYIFVLKDGREFYCNFHLQDGIYTLSTRAENIIVPESDVKEHHENVIHSAHSEFQLPNVILLSRYEKLPQQRVHFSRRTIYRRDNFTCFHPDTNILMGDGTLLPISKIKTGDIILDMHGKEEIVEYVHCRDVKNGEMMSIRHRGNGDFLRCTQEHKLIPFKWNGDCQKNGISARDVSLETYLAEIIPTIKPSVLNFDLAEICSSLKNLKIGDDYVKHYCGNNHKRFVKADWEVGKLAGYYLAEGSVSGNNVSFSFNSSEIDYIQEVKYILLNRFGCVGVCYLDGNKAVVICSSSVLGCFFKKIFGVKNGKKLRWRIFSKDFLTGVLYGIMRGDAAFNMVQSRCTLQMSRPSLIRDVYLASLACGLMPTLSKTGSRDDGRIYKSVVFNAKEFNRICEMANINYNEYVSKKNSKYDRNKVENYLISKVCKIEEDNYSGPVYDLQVSGSHTYVANFVCVHNCQYCGAQPGTEELSLDHIVPRSQGGLTSWTNVTLACLVCNSRKANRTPAQAGMKLLSVPKKPKFNLLRGDKVNIRQSWSSFISEQYWQTELENDMK